MDYRQELVSAFAEKARSFGYEVWLAEAGTYGFYSDSEGKRVAGFQFTLAGGVSVSGSYLPTRESGDGWMIVDSVHPDSVTEEDLKAWLNASAPRWANSNPIYTTPSQQLAMYGQSSKYSEVTPTEIGE